MLIVHTDFVKEINFDNIFMDVLPIAFMFSLDVVLIHIDLKKKKKNFDGTSRLVKIFGGGHLP